MGDRIVCPICGHSLHANLGEVAENTVSDGRDDGSIVLVSDTYDYAGGPQHAGIPASFAHGPANPTVSGAGQGQTASSGRRLLAQEQHPELFGGTDPDSRRAYLYGVDEDPLVRADADFAGAEEDWTAAADQLWALRYDLTHTSDEEPKERSLSEDGARQLAAAERNELRLHRLYEVTRDKRAALLTEYERNSQPFPPGLTGSCQWPEGGCTCYESGPHYQGGEQDRPKFR